MPRDRNRWQYRARATLRSVGMRAKPGVFYIRKLMNQLIENPDGVDSEALESLGLAERFITLFDEELKYIEIQHKLRTKHVDAVERL